LTKLFDGLFAAGLAIAVVLAGQPVPCMSAAPAGQAVAADAAVRTPIPSSGVPGASVLLQDGPGDLPNGALLTILMAGIVLDDNVPVGAGGSFSVIVTVPELSPGNYSIEVYTGASAVTFPFTVMAPAIPTASNTATPSARSTDTPSVAQSSATWTPIAPAPTQSLTPTPLSGASGSLIVAPDSGPPGSAGISVGAIPGTFSDADSVYLFFVDSHGSMMGLPSAPVRDDGSFSASVTLPSMATYGLATIAARAGVSGRQVDGQYFVIPVVHVQPPEVVPGAALSVSADGFPANSVLAFAIDDMSVPLNPPASTNDLGHSTASIVVPATLAADLAAVLRVTSLVDSRTATTTLSVLAMTPTVTPSPTHTQSPTHTESPSRTATPSASATPTRTSSPTRTVTQTLTPSPTRTATQTHTVSPTRTATQTHTASPTRTATQTHSVTPTRTVTQTRTVSPTRTVTQTCTASPTSTPTQTRGPSATRTRTPTHTASPTRTMTQTRTATGTRAPVPSRPMKSTPTPFTPTATPKTAPAARLARVSVGGAGLSTVMFAEGYTGLAAANGHATFTEVLSVMNPSNQPASLTFSYFIVGRKSPIVVARSLEPFSALRELVNGDVGMNKEVSAVVSSSRRVVVSRTILRQSLIGGHLDGSTTTGASAPSTAWYFAEGYTGQSFKEYLTEAWS
jgi:hypothetical protein